MFLNRCVKLALQLSNFFFLGRFVLFGFLNLFAAVLAAMCCVAVNSSDKWEEFITKDIIAIGRIAGNLSKLGLTIRGTHGEGTEPKGSLYQLSNQVTLGISEKAAIENLKNITSQLISQEELARERICSNIDVQDSISRSLGILKYARTITHDEALQLLSNVRLGIVCGQLKDVPLLTIDKLMTDVEPATLMVNSGKNLSAAQRDVARADLLRKTLN